MNSCVEYLTVGIMHNNSLMPAENFFQTKGIDGLEKINLETIILNNGIPGRLTWMIGGPDYMTPQKYLDIIERGEDPGAYFNFSKIEKIEDMKNCQKKVEDNYAAIESIGRDLYQILNYSEHEIIVNAMKNDINEGKLYAEFMEGKRKLTKSKAQDAFIYYAFVINVAKEYLGCTDENNLDLKCEKIMEVQKLRTEIIETKEILKGLISEVENY